MIVNEIAIYFIKYSQRMGKKESLYSEKLSASRTISMNHLGSMLGRVTSEGSVRMYQINQNNDEHNGRISFTNT